MSQPSNNGENQSQTTDERNTWDVFEDPPVENLSGSLQETKYIDFMTKLCKVLSYIITFLVVLGSSSISKGTLLFITSQIGSNVTRPYCNELIDRNKVFEVTIPNIERVAWIWILIFIYFVSELLTCIRSILVCIFKTWKYPTLSECFSLFATESFPAIGSALLVFSILPELDVIKGVMLTNAVCFVPAVMGTISRKPHEENSITKIYLDVASILAQLSAFLVWPMIENQLVMWLIPVSVCMISIGWWENFVSEGVSLKIVKQEENEKKKIRLENSRYFLYIFVPIWKCVLFFITTIIIIWLKEGSVDFMFDYFEEAFQSHTINVTEIKPIIDEQEDYGPVFNNTNNTLILADNLTPVWVFLINIFSSYICYIFAKFACKTLIQEFSFAFPLNLTVPTTVAILIALSGVYIENPCAFYPTIPSYLFFKIPPLYFLEQFLATEHVWIWILWLLSQTWVTVYVWSPKSERLAKTEKLFIKPMYDSFLVDQSLLLIRRRDENSEKIEDDWDDNTNSGEFENKTIKSNTLNDTECYTTQIYICGTMWHETQEEMLQFLKSIFRLDYDQAICQIVKNKIQPDFQDYYKLESHIFFDDALISKNDPNPKVNDYVENLVAAVGKAAYEVHECEVTIQPPKKYTTPYGGRLVWKLPGRTLLCVHLKDSKKVRQEKRWSQVLYMFYLLGYRFMEYENFSIEQKRIVAENTFLLALDGDIDFQPKDVHLLIDLMKRNNDLGAACGRLHPTGSGPLAWYQKFEYAIGHWLQKSAEHVIGCVLCSPGCFSLYRGYALMTDGVMQRYTAIATQARHSVQYDMGEDRWLCSLLLQSGYRIEYSAASDAYTNCPESFDVFYKQRRRWMPSTTANIMDLLFNYKRVIKVNDNISRLYILYQMVLLIGTVLGPGTIFLMLVGAFSAVFQMDQWTSFLWNAVPILIYMAVCILFEKEVQILFAGILSAVYGLVMMAVLIGVLLQIRADGVLAPSSLFFFCFAGELILTALLHPKELNCLLYGLVYYLTVPSMYMILVIYAVFNLNDISWGTRETTSSPKTDEESDKTEKQKPKKKVISFFSEDKMDNPESFEFSIAGLIKCFFCTHSKKSENEEKLSEISANLLEVAKKLSALEKASSFSSESSTPMSDKQTSQILYEDKLPWYDQAKLGHGKYQCLKPDEREFFEDLIEKYLKPLKRKDTEKKKMKDDLKDLRDKTVMAFFMINSLFVLVVFLLTLKKDLLHLDWPLDAKYNFTYNSDRREIALNRTPLELEPIGFVFLIFFASLLVVQFIAMLFHRFSTFSQIMANTIINTRSWLQRKKKKESDKNNKRLTKEQVQEAARLKGANDDDEDKKRKSKGGKGKTVTYFKKQQTKAETQPINDVFEAFERRLKNNHTNCNEND